MLSVTVKSTGFDGNVSFDLSVEEAEAILDAETADEVLIGTNGERVSVDTSESVTWHERRANGTYRTWPMDRADLMKKLEKELAQDKD
ncbi:hypothetical protein FHG66_20200 [Rubellimicrobium rubrum]|uniref:Uncharacterized protein n=1 Tax=Rubellimicrobium rubrum TaxID=2585369 RepID=A0A5C4MLA0_9RHOB|nr:hypothetical protein [Rubellimicrobium rubrum]TNC45273.1 hypothetical protein FHG66_20200 [Rubellimicrobium rubrum]